MSTNLRRKQAPQPQGMQFYSRIADNVEVGRVGQPERLANPASSSALKVQQKFCVFACLKRPYAFATSNSRTLSVPQYVP
jgi:hypothetical protein